MLERGENLPLLAEAADQVIAERQAPRTSLSATRWRKLVIPLGQPDRPHAAMAQLGSTRNGPTRAPSATIGSAPTARTNGAA